MGRCSNNGNLTPKFPSFLPRVHFETYYFVYIWFITFAVLQFHNYFIFKINGRKQSET
jgi:hypothetical protein